MKVEATIPSRPVRLLGIEGGGTRTVALYVEQACTLRWQGGPGNLRLLSDGELDDRLGEVARRFPRPEAVGIGMAGARTTADILRITRAAGRCWPGVPCHATNDLETALAAQPPVNALLPRVLVLSGTGSCCYGIAPGGARLRVGGWGHVLGDRGSGYQIGLAGLQSAIAAYDRESQWPALGAQMLRRLQLNVPDQLMNWAQTATKDEMAALAVEVFSAAAHGDSLAIRILRDSQAELAADALACAQRLSGKKGHRIEFVFAGSTLLKQPRFADGVARHIRSAWPAAHFQHLVRESAWGAVELAARLVGAAVPPEGTQKAGAAPAKPLMLSTTEERNSRSMELDRLSLRQAIALMLSEDARIPNAIRTQLPALERALRLIVRSLKQGGRLLYVGAGTSGRLGILDASECPPTFRTAPEMVQGIIAGGRNAIWEAAEGAEDDEAAGAQAILFRNVSKRDVVVGIAASGTTPFVWGALDAARMRKAATVLLCFNPRITIPAARRPTVVLAIPTGPEILTGSTRLKAGTATKLVLNIFSTLAMVRLGKVAGNLMVDLNPSNVKLRSRAVRIVSELTKTPEAEAKSTLEACGWQVPQSLTRLGWRQKRSVKRR